MPHLCDECGHKFPNGSQEMLSGCPDCGGAKFQYVPEGKPTASPSKSAESQTPPSADDTEIIEADSSPSPTRSGEDSAQQAARSDIIEPDEIESNGSVSDFVSGLQSTHSETESDDTDASNEPTPSASDTDAESNSAPGLSKNHRLSGSDENSSSRRMSDTETLRKELLDQFESIKIREPGSYELNLRKLYEREEHIIQIQEDGKYVIQMPER